MPEEFKAGCQRPSSRQTSQPQTIEKEETAIKEEKPPMIKVGKPAPDFTLPAFIKGKFANVSLSEYKGKWVLVCFYPGDFTFV